MRTQIRIVGGIALVILGVFLVVGLWVESVPIVGGKTDVWQYSEIALPVTSFESVPNKIAVELVRPSRTAVVTTAPIIHPEEYNLELINTGNHPLFAYNLWLLAPYILLGAVVITVGLYTVLDPWLRGALKDDTAKQNS